MMALTFIVHALEPLLMTRLEGDPNSAVSYPYVPGSVLRGAVIGRLPEPRRERLTVEPLDRRLFLGGGVRYLNAYPQYNGVRLLPSPASWLREKINEAADSPHIWYDLSHNHVSVELPKSAGPGFCCIKGGQVAFHEPTWHINVHTARERLRGRATEDEGAVFRYQAIPRGTRFAGAILIEQPADVDQLIDLLADGDLWLGGARSAGYGHVRLENVTKDEHWAEAPNPISDLNPPDRLVITLLSDALLRTTHGNEADRLLRDHLPAEIGDALEPVSVFKRLTLVGGFDRKWGLPLEQRYAVQAGSVFVFKVNRPIAATALRTLLEQGVGERRAEGFGRVAINWHAQQATLTECKLTDLLPAPDQTEPIEGPRPITLSGNSAWLAEQMNQRLLRRLLDRQLAETAQSEACRVFHAPAKAQLSRLRNVALSALPTGDVPRVKTFLNDKLKARAADQYHTAKIGRQRLLNWLRERVADPTTIWQQLKAESLTPPQIGSVGVDWKSDAKLCNEYTLRLIEAVLHRAAKEQ